MTTASPMMNAIRALGMGLAFAAWGWSSIKNGEVHFRFLRPLSRATSPVGYRLMLGAIALVLFICSVIFAFSVYQTQHPESAPNTARSRTFAEQSADAYPAAARRQGIGGKVLLRCVADAAFHPRNCSVLSETPTGYGFASSALKIAAMMTLAEADRPKVQSGEPFDLPIRFAEPDQTPARHKP